MKRQRGRNRGGGGGSGGGGKPQAQNANRAFDSNGPEGSKVRGNAQHVFEKYQQLARDASAAGDRVLGENYLQHAEHYFRLLRAMQPTRPASEILGRDHFSSGFDIDFEDESAQAQSEAADQASAEAGETPETWQARDGQPPQGALQHQNGQQRDERPRDQNRDDRPRDDRPRYENRDRNDGQGGQNRDGQNRDGQGRRDRPWRDERPRDDRARDDNPQQQADRPRDDRPPRDERPRDDRPRGDRPRDDRPRDERPRFDRSRDDRPARDPLPIVEPQGSPLVNEDRSAREERAPREDRPQREERQPRAERPARVLRDADGGESHAPAFLQAPPPRAAAEPAEGEAKPRRKRAPKPASEAEDA
jgi:hypothetical protein